MEHRCRCYYLPDAASLQTAYRQLCELPWIESLSIDLQELALHVSLARVAAPSEPAAERRFQQLEKYMVG